MREIKFRAKRLSDNEFVYGFFSGSFSDEMYDFSCIWSWNEEEQDQNWDEVDKETLGQFTGLKDKNGVEIYEGDILQIESEKVMVVGWSKKFASFVLDRDGWAFSHWFGESCSPSQCEIVGNIHDNPGML